MEATKEKMVDLKPKAEKISVEELEDLQQVVNENNAIQFRVGALEAQKHELMHKQAGVQAKIVEMQNRFSETYGTFDINLTDGTINYPEDGQSRD